MHEGDPASPALDWLPVACAAIGTLTAASIFSSSYASPAAEQLAAGVMVLVTVIGAGHGLFARGLSPAARVAGALCTFLLISAIVLALIVSGPLSAPPAPVPLKIPPPLPPAVLPTN